MGGGLGPVSCAKGVVDVDIAQGGHFLGQLFVVFLFAFVDPAVLQQNDLTRLYRKAALHPVLNQGDLAAHDLAHAQGNRGQ